MLLSLKDNGEVVFFSISGRESTCETLIFSLATGLRWDLQVGVTQAVVDWEPSCGNMLAGVGPAAIEMGLISQVDQVETKVRIRALNNGTFVEALVQTPNGQVGARLLLQSMAITCGCSYFLRFVLPLLLSVVELKVLGHML